LTSDCDLTFEQIDNAFNAMLKGIFDESAVCSTAESLIFKSSHDERYRSQRVRAQAWML